jgi:hypothetical protein
MGYKKQGRLTPLTTRRRNGWSSTPAPKIDRIAFAKEVVCSSVVLRIHTISSYSTTLYLGFLLETVQFCEETVQRGECAGGDGENNPAGFSLGLGCWLGHYVYYYNMRRRDWDSWP